jgi:hypothetical protein
MSIVGHIISEFHIVSERLEGTHNICILILILQTMTDKNFSTKRGTMNWLFADLQRALDTVVKEASLLKLGGGELTKFTEGIKQMFVDIKMRVER